MDTSSSIVFPHLTKPALSVEARQYFLLRVYGTLLAQCLLTAFVVHAIRQLHHAGRFVVFSLHQPAEEAVAASGGAGVDGQKGVLVLTGFGQSLVLLGQVGPLLSLLLLIPFRKMFPFNLAFLGLFALSESCILAVATLYVTDDEQILAKACATTLALFGALSSYAIQNKKENFGWMAQFLCAAAAVFLVLCFSSLLFGFRDSDLILGFGAVLTAGFLVFDTWRIHQNYDASEWLLASIDLYLDLVNLFFYLLRLMSKKK